MKNVKGFAVASDGNMKRIAITYDDIDDTTGKIINPNVKVNRIINSSDANFAVSTIESYAQTIVDSE